MDAVTVLTVLVLLVLLGVPAVSIARYWAADTADREVLRLAWRVRRTWHRTAVRCGLFQAEHGAKVGAEVPLVGELRRSGAERILIPRITVTPVTGGLRIEVKTVGRVGLEAFDKASGHLADAWRVRFVQVTPGKPGYLRLRATVRDALRSPVAYTPPASVDLRRWEIGPGRDGDLVSVRTSDVSGIAVGGLSGFGKTTLVDSDGYVGAHFDGLSGAHLRDGFNGAHRALRVGRFEPGPPLIE